MGAITDIVLHSFLFIALYFEVFLLITFFERGAASAGNRARAPKRFPTVAIIVPCYNEARTVVRTIQSVLRLDYPKEKLQIIAVDDGSRDDTWQVLQRFKHNPRVALYRKENGGKHTALNHALARTDAEFVGCLDADSYVDPNALQEIVKEFETGHYQAIIPAIKVHKPGNVLQYIQQAEYTMSIFIRKVFTALDGNFVTPGPFSIFRREIFTRIGTYRKAHNTEDLEMALRLQSNYHKIGNAHTAYVYTNTPGTFLALFRQRVRWTYGFIKNVMDYRFMLLKPRYGNIGLMILPITLISIFSAIYFMALFSVSMASKIAEHYVRLQVVGLSAPSFTLDWFFFNTQSILWITFAVVAGAYLAIVLGKRLAGDDTFLSRDILFYIVLYGFLAPWWLAKALVNAALSRQGNWTAERN